MCWRGRALKGWASSFSQARAAVQSFAYCAHPPESRPRFQKEGAARGEEEVLSGEYDLDELAAKRLEWGLFRDRRPEMYGIIAGQK